MAQESEHTQALIREGSFEVAPGWSIFYRYRQSARLSLAPTWIFLNGLGDDLSQWSSFAEALEGRVTLQVDLRGQGQSLEHRLAIEPESDFRIPVETHSADLHFLLSHLGVQGAVVIAGYSYGGGVAIDFASRWPERVHRLALIVPFVIRLDRSFPMQRIFTWQWQMAKGFGLLPAPLASSLERGYETFLSSYMNQRYQRRLSDPRMRRVAIELSHGIMSFDAFQVLADLPDQSVFLLTSDLDTLVPRSLFHELWTRLPEEKKGHWTQVPDGDHLLLEQKPELVLEWLKLLA